MGQIQFAIVVVEIKKIKRKLLYINYDYPPISGPGVWRALGFTEYLSKNGYDITVLCADRSYRRHRYDDTLLRRIPSDVRIKRLKNISPSDISTRVKRIIRFRGNTSSSMLSMEQIPPSPQDRYISESVNKSDQTRLEATNNQGFLNVLNRYINEYYPDNNFIWFVKVTLIGLYLKLFSKFDCMITSGPPHISHISGLIIRKLTGTPWIMDYRDLWNDDSAQSPQDGYQKTLSIRAEACAVESADAVVTVSPSWVDHLKAKYGQQNQLNKYHLIRNGHNLEQLPDYGFMGTDHRKKLHIHFNGTPQTLSYTTSLLDALSSLLQHNELREDDLIITFTGIDDAFAREVCSRSLNKFIVDVKGMTQRESIEFSSKCDAALVIVNNDNMSREGTIPAKTYEAMALGMHILAIVPFKSDVRELLTEYGNATICNVDNRAEICSALKQLIASHQEKKLQRVISLERNKYVFEKYSRTKQAQEMSNIIESLIAESVCSK